MLRSLHDLAKYQVSASDGEIGRVTDFWFDEKTWTIRYLVVDTGGFWHGPRRVLISPKAFQKADWSTRRFQLTLTKQQVRHSPSLDAARPVCWQYERDYFQYYGWPYWGLEAYPAVLASRAIGGAFPRPAGIDPDICSIREVTGNRVQSSDTELGRLADFIVDDTSWRVRYLRVGTGGRWFGEKLLVELRWAPELSRSERRVYLRCPRESLRALWVSGSRRLPPLRPYRVWASGGDSADRSRAAETR